jgi:hypothetical protein
VTDGVQETSGYAAIRMSNAAREKQNSTSALHARMTSAPMSRSRVAADLLKPAT